MFLPNLCLSHLIVVGWLAVGGWENLRAQDGVFADVSTTQGDFTCSLDFVRAPRTVANFLTLAAGTRTWLELTKGEAAQRPFYNGLTFHRVVSGFVIQGGSPKGDGTDGPGYTFRDEFNVALRHSRAGILSMANSGPHSNGSQFFITLAATPSLDDVHSVFGEVTSGLAVVSAIGTVSVDANSRPMTPVVMQSVTIRRVGMAANAFEASGQGLPAVGGAGPRLMRNGTAWALQFPRALYSEYTLYDSANLASWSRQRLGLYVTSPPVGNQDVTASATGQGAHYYRVAQVAYPGPVYTPMALSGMTVDVSFTGGGSLTLNINALGGGTSNYNNGGSIGAFGTHSWLQEAYRGQLYVDTSDLVPLLFNFVFNSATAGTFKGTAYTSPNPGAISGTFSVPAPVGAPVQQTLKKASISRK